MSLYVLFYTALMKPGFHTVTISEVTSAVFNDLYRDHADTLICPCSTNAIPYKDFVSNTITFHPVCSSLFVSQQWISALHFDKASDYGMTDFRTSASSQNLIYQQQQGLAMNPSGASIYTMRLNKRRQLGSLCALSQSIVLHNQNDIGDKDFLTISLLPEAQIQSEVTAAVEFSKSSASVGISSFLNYLRIANQANNLISALNTNALMVMANIYNQFHFYAYPTAYSPYDALSGMSSIRTSCGSGNIITPAALPEYLSTYLYTLYGGLIIIFRLFVPFLIKILVKIKRRSRNINIDLTSRNTCFNRFSQSLKRFNLFKVANDRTESSIKQQMMVTRIYFVLLAGSIIVLVLFTSLSTQTVTITVLTPTLTTYNNLQILYSDTLRCPCSTIIIPYQTFVSLSPVFHQVCSSDLIDDRWLKILKDGTNSMITTDWRNIAASQFSLLSELCRLANKTVDDAVHRLLLQAFIASSVLTEINFNIQLNTTLEEFFQSTTTSFGFSINAAQLLLQVDQPFMASLPTDGASFEVYLISNESTNYMSGIPIANRTNYPPVQLSFPFNGPVNINSTDIECICATNSNCQEQVTIYYNEEVGPIDIDYNIAYIVPGSFDGCSPVDSLQLSTLECFYSGSDCFSSVIKFIEQTYVETVLDSQWFYPRPLNYDSAVSRFPPNISIKTILQDMMIERWNISRSYNSFYESCAPSYCTYSQTIRTKTIFEVTLTLISMIGGLIVSLRIITPQIVKFIIFLLTIINKRRQQQQQQQHQQQQQRARIKWSDQLKNSVRNLFSLIYTALSDLNIFLLRDFGSKIERRRATKLGQWSTRLYIVLLLVSFTILALFTIVQPETITKIYNKPSFDLYNQLSRRYGNELKCLCSSITSTYDQFVEIEPVFHPICSSSFSSDEWRMNLTAGLVANLSTYSQRDYRRFLSAHLQYLQGLCRLSIELVNNSVNQFLSSLMITTQILPETAFNRSLDLLIQQRQSTTPTKFSDFFFLTRSINHGNAYMSTYGTNFVYISRWYTLGSYLSTQALTYDDNCFCGIYSNCTSQANFIDMAAYSQIVPLKGLKIGCTPKSSTTLTNSISTQINMTTTTLTTTSTKSSTATC
ncbi:hypothetical protein I4U23_010897 [Adineta vaga]|nr:hypothetical protein I4U23_010897 [Adineta vaga]